MLDKFLFCSKKFKTFPVSSICDSSSLDDNCLAGDYSTSGLIGDISLLENDVVDDHIVQNSPLNVYANLHSASTGVCIIIVIIF